jgi:hypothetical protein
MFITKKHLSRRTFLRGTGVTVALPFLESMLPAQTPLSRTAAMPKSRLSCIYIPHGATMDHWTPAAEGKGFEFTEILKPLEPYRDYVNVISGLCHPQAGPTDGEDSGGALDHNRAVATFLTGAHPKKGAQSRVGVSVDQLIADKAGQDTPLPSIRWRGFKRSCLLPIARVSSSIWKKSARSSGGFKRLRNRRNPTSRCPRLPSAFQTTSKSISN